MRCMPAANANDIEPDPKKANYHPLVIVLAATALGIVADNYRPLPVGLWWSIALGGLIAWLILWRLDRIRIAAAVLLIAVAAIAASWHHCRWSLFADDDLGSFARSTGQPVCVEAIVLKTPRLIPRSGPDPMRTTRTGDQVRFEVELLNIRDGQRWLPASGRATVFVAGPLPDVFATDRIRIFGRLTAPPRPLNPGEFDYRSYLRSNRIRSQLSVQYADCVTRIENGAWWNPRRLIEQARMHSNRLFERYLTVQQQPVAAAVLLGIREQLDTECTNSYTETGTIHLLSISGLHLAILAGGVLLVMRRMPVSRGKALLVVAAFTTFYMVLVDAEPPVVRATVLVLTMCVSLYFGRHTMGFNALATAALVVLILNPLDLFRTGTQLSFLCVATLMLFAPLWNRTRRQDPIDRLVEANQPFVRRQAVALSRRVWNILSISAVVWLMTLPLVLARFHLFTPIGVLLNPLVCLPMGVAMVSGFALLVLGTVCPPLAPLCGTICDWNLGLLQWLVRLGQRVPWGHWWLPGPADWWLVGFYGGVGLMAAFPRLRPSRRGCAVLLVIWTTLGFAPRLFRSHGDELRCTFLSVGHGEAVVLQLPSGRTVLYDAGRFSAPTGVTRTISEFLWSEGIAHIDSIVISHGDVDHFNGVPGLLDRFSVGEICVSPVMFKHRSPALESLHEAINRARVPIHEFSIGEQLNGGPGCALRVLYPLARGVDGRDNANSLVLAVEYAGRRILLTGDIEPPGLDDVLAKPPYHCDVLLVPHHGSRQSDPTRLSAWATPRWAVISADRRWNLRPVRAIYEQAGGEVIHTAYEGATFTTIHRDEIEVTTFLDPSD